MFCNLFITKLGVYDVDDCKVLYMYYLVINDK